MNLSLKITQATTKDFCGIGNLTCHQDGRAPGNKSMMRFRVKAKGVDLWDVEARIVCQLRGDYLNWLRTKGVLHGAVKPDA